MQTFFVAKYIPSNGTSKGFGFVLTLLTILKTKLWTKLSSQRRARLTQGTPYSLHKVSSRPGTISNFQTISISIFLKFSFSISISISILFWQKNQYRDKHQYQYFFKTNIKTNINIFQNPESISISRSIPPIYWYWYWKSIILWTTIIAFKTSLFQVFMR